MPSGGQDAATSVPANDETVNISANYYNTEPEYSESAQSNLVNKTYTYRYKQKTKKTEFIRHNIFSKYY